MYFKSRAAAGEQLASQIAKKYTDGDECALVALSDGGVIVGAHIAMQLRAPLMMLLAERITLPREDQALAGISQDGSFSYNHHYSQGEIDEFVSEYYHYIEAEKMNKIHEMHRLARKGGLIRKDLLQGRNIMLISDGLQDGFLIDVALQFLKTVQTKRLIVVTPFASVPAVDRMHILADEIYCLSVIEDYISTDHYYEEQDVPEHDKIVATIEKIVSHWV
jgi:putative phosphoribosyl transferase